MKMDEMGAMTGMPVGRKKTRRGPRKHASAGVSKDPHDHMHNLKGALESDDHHGARKHAFHLIRSLRPSSDTPAEEVGESPAVDTKAEESAEAAPKPNRMLAAVVALRKKRG